MQGKLIRCPICNKPFLKYIEGTATYEIKCGLCKNIIKIFSAGRTVKCEPMSHSP